ncbi:MAG TPA: sigma 54-interacting transcriptional regulator [Acidobacteriaceae bacterium]|nr:sigma 54-interacting transcriptional regulator [Acidobacteriaceae bacterium]
MSSPSRVLPFASVAPSNARRSAAGIHDGTQLLVGPSRALARLWSQIRLLAPHFRVALLTGEPGTGAESVARALHDLSSFADTPLVSLHASEADRQLRSPAALFGGGLRGALFISEIERLSPHSQQALLRLIRLRRHRRVAVVASATRDLRPLISAGAFNPELAAQLGSLRLALPCLRERSEDLPLLASDILHAEAGRLGLPAPALDPSFLARATAFEWPGNLDQLRSALTWLLENRPDFVLTAADLDAALAVTRVELSSPDLPVRMVTLDKVVQEHVRAVLIGCNGNKLRAAEVLGISRSTLYRMLDTNSPGPFALAG